MIYAKKKYLILLKKQKKLGIITRFLQEFIDGDSEYNKNFNSIIQSIKDGINATNATNSQGAFSDIEFTDVTIQNLIVDAMIYRNLYYIFNKIDR